MYAVLRLAIRSLEMAGGMAVWWLVRRDCYGFWLVCGRGGGSGCDVIWRAVINEWLGGLRRSSSGRWARGGFAVVCKDSGACV